MWYAGFRPTTVIREDGEIIGTPGSWPSSRGPGNTSAVIRDSRGRAYPLFEHATGRVPRGDPRRIAVILCVATAAIAVGVVLTLVLLVMLGSS
jgi:hypothetical protein